MFFVYTFVFVSLVNFLCGGFQGVHGCDQNCADKPEFSPSRLIVKHGESTSAKCFICREACLGTGLSDLEIPVGSKEKNGTTISWRVDSLTQWTLKPFCYYTEANDNQCCTYLPVTVYKPPDSVSFSFFNHSGPMREGREYTLLCEVQNFAPAANLVVTFYKGGRALDQQQSSKTETKPVTEIFTLSITASKEDDRAEFSCDAKLELGPEGPQPPPVLKSQNIPATVYYKPRLESPSNPDPVTVTVGNPLTLSCLAVGNPSPFHTWSTPPPAGLLPPNSSVLTVKSVTYAHEGEYVCSVSNVEGTVTVRFRVNVQANILPFIIFAVIAFVVVLAICMILGFKFYYSRHRTGKYDLKDVFRFKKQHVALPTGD